MGVFVVKLRELRCQNSAKYRVVVNNGNNNRESVLYSACHQHARSVGGPHSFR